MPKFTKISRQFKVISLSARSMKRLTIMSNSFWHFRIWFSLARMNDKLRRIKIIRWRCSRSSSSEISWGRIESSFFFVSCKSSSCFLLRMGLRPRWEGTWKCKDSWGRLSYSFCSNFYSRLRISIRSLENLPN